MRVIALKRHYAEGQHRDAGETYHTSDDLAQSLVCQKAVKYASNDTETANSNSTRRA